LRNYIETVSKGVLGVLSLLIVGWGQPAGIPWFGIIAASCGYAFFWFSIKDIQSSWLRFFYACIWFSGVQALELSWMASIEYQGIYILFVYIGICLWLGMQFGILSLFVPKKYPFLWTRLVALASIWTLMEWGRLYILCGFSWNPVGLALCSYVSGMQLASIGGIFFLSFWVISTNLWIYRSIFFQKVTLSRISLCLFLALFPWLFGEIRLKFASPMISHENKTLSALLIQTGLFPSEKSPLKDKIEDFISPYEQWRRILYSLKEYQQTKPDLIIFPETAVPFSSNVKIYLLDYVKKIFSRELNEKALDTFPSLESTYIEKKEQSKWWVSNLFWAQAVANFFQSDILIGLDHQDAQEKSYNAALHLQPHEEQIHRYEKRVLVPLAEYLPFEWLRPLVKSYGISDFFTPGTEAKIFYYQNIPFSVSICYEETFPHLIREGRKKGALFFVNLTNDNWYPSSSLPKMHFYHGSLRAVENGIPLLRACNTGLTAAVDPYGRIIAQLKDGKKNFEKLQGVLPVTFHLEKVNTLYSFWGDGPIIGLCFFFLFLFLIARKFTSIKLD